VDAGVKELNEMTIGRTDDPENPSRATAFEAASLFGAGSRIPSGPAAMLPRQQAGHMIAIDPIVGILDFSLASRGPSTHALAKHDDEGRQWPETAQARVGTDRGRAMTLNRRDKFIPT
jgi:hypothetical protein